MAEPGNKSTAPSGASFREIMKIKPVIKVLGSKKAIGDACGLTKQAVQHWLIVPPKYQKPVKKAVYKKQIELRKAIGFIDKYIGELEDDLQNDK